MIGYKHYLCHFLDQMHGAPDKSRVFEQIWHTYVNNFRSDFDMDMGQGACGKNQQVLQVQGYKLRSK